MKGSMETLLIAADRAVLPGGVLEEDPVYVTVDGGKISGVFRGRSSAPVTDYPTMHTPLLCPGFVDTHTHGLGKVAKGLRFRTNNPLQPLCTK